MTTQNSANINTTISATRAITYPVQPAFFAYLSATATNQTGDGTIVSLVSNTVQSNVSSSYSGSTGIFTAPITGIYSLHWCICCSSIAGGHTSFIGKLIATSGTYQIIKYNPHLEAAGTSSQLQSGFLLLKMTAGDTASITIQVSGSTKTVGIIGSAFRSRFGGKLEV